MSDERGTPRRPTRAVAAPGTGYPVVDPAAPDSATPGSAPPVSAAKEDAVRSSSRQLLRPEGVATNPRPAPVAGRPSTESGAAVTELPSAIVGADPEGSATSSARGRVGARRLSAGARWSVAEPARRTLRTLRALGVGSALPTTVSTADVEDPPERVPRPVLAALAMAGIMLAVVPLLVVALSGHSHPRPAAPTPAASFVQSGAPVGVVPRQQSSAP